MRYGLTLLALVASCILGMSSAWWAGSKQISRLQELDREGWTRSVHESDFVRDSNDSQRHGAGADTSSQLDSAAKEREQDHDLGTPPTTVREELEPSGTDEFTRTGHSKLEGTARDAAEALEAAASLQARALQSCEASMLSHHHDAAHTCTLHLTLRSLGTCPRVVTFVRARVRLVVLSCFLSQAEAQLHVPSLSLSACMHTVIAMHNTMPREQASRSCAARCSK
jgi:hypothetical protein